MQAELDAGPPPAELYRCAAYGHLLAELRPGDQRAALNQSLQALDGVIRILRRTQPVVSDGERVPGYEDVRGEVRELADRAGAGREQWVASSWSNCAAQIAWARRMTGA